MGGKALKNVFTRRYTDAEYKALVKELVPMFTEVLGTEVTDTLPYSTKDSHGDLDLLVKMPMKIDYEKLKSYLHNSLGSGEIVKNGSVISFEYRNFQVDLIGISANDWESAQMYFSYGDLGNLLGRLANMLGMKYGTKGLFYKVYDESRTKKLGEIAISSDGNKILKFLGLDPAVFHRGFDTEESVFQYISTSKYFHPGLGSPDNQTHSQKHRGKRRASLVRYSEWVKREHQSDVDFPPRLTPDEAIGLIDAAFPEVHIQDKVNKLLGINARKKAVADKFSGHTVMKHFPELTGKALGRALTQFRLWVDENVCSHEGCYENYILDTPLDQILSTFASVNQLNRR